MSRGFSATAELLVDLNKQKDMPNRKTVAARRRDMRGSQEQFLIPTINCASAIINVSVGPAAGAAAVAGRLRGEDKLHRIADVRCVAHRSRMMISSAAAAAADDPVKGRSDGHISTA